MPGNLDDPRYWRNRAEEVRTHAERMQHPDTKRMMLRVAEEQDRLDEVLERTRGRVPNGLPDR
jgi:hypothetical protein